MRRRPRRAVQVRDRAHQEGEAARRVALLDAAADGGLPPVRHAAVHRIPLRRHRLKGTVTEYSKDYRVLTQDAP